MFGSPGMSCPEAIQLKLRFLMLMLYPWVNPVATPLKTNIIASVMIKDGSLSITVSVPLSNPESKPTVIAVIIIHGPPYGKK